MSLDLAKNWITLFITGGYILSFLAALIGALASLSLINKLGDYINPATRQDVKPSTLVAYGLVATIGLSFVSFIEVAHYGVYGSLGAITSGAGNPLSWSSTSTPTLGEGQSALALMVVILVGFSFIGGVAFFNCFLTTYRFDKLHPQHHGAVKDFLMYLFGGIVCTSLPVVLAAIATIVPILKGVSDMVNRASAIL